jgi:hypothetical protein
VVIVMIALAFCSVAHFTAAHATDSSGPQSGDESFTVLKRTS